MTLNVKAGNRTKEAVLAGNVAANKLEFVYTVDESDEGTLTATGEVNVKDGRRSRNDTM